MKLQVGDVMSWGMKYVDMVLSIEGSDKVVWVNLMTGKIWDGFSCDIALGGGKAILKNDVWLESSCESL